MNRNVIIGVILGILGGFYGNLIGGGIGRSSFEFLLGLFIAFLLAFFVYHQFGIKINRWFVNIFAALVTGLLVRFFNGPAVVAAILGILASLTIWPIVHQINDQIGMITSKHPRGVILVSLLITLALITPLLLWASSRQILKEIIIVVVLFTSPIIAIIFVRYLRV